ncbi:unknown protein [Seminavis robusta]|uniref:Uncharacterized protein n=1 Tax=Seminavis robusta TaxID=568900 RepID=A0A9N8H8F3_9STRA|nr:unknown protein [Seminavis robusta]|eukprot:Sro158_g071530.1 n/a (343) ;mRNA; r:39030-40151
MSVSVDHASEDFRRLCNRLEENDEDLVKVNAVVIPEMAQLQALGRVFIKKTHTTGFRLICNPWVEAMDMWPLWEGLFQSKTLKKLFLYGFQMQHNAIVTFLTGCNGYNSTTPRIHFATCFIGTLETDAIVKLLQRQDMNNFRFHISSCKFDMPENSTGLQQRIAEALTHNTTVKSFGFEGSLEDSTCAQAFGNVIAVNKTLRGVSFEDCGDLAVPLITQGIVQNHRLASAKVKGSSLPPSIQIQGCQRQIKHSIEMNRAGRYHMYHCARQDGEMELDSTWLRLLIQNIGEKHTIIYSWLRDYVDIFTRCALCGMAGQKRTETASSKGDDGRGPNKRAKTGSS